MNKQRNYFRLATIGANTHPMAASSGFCWSPGLSTSFTYGRSANQGMGSHPKIHPPGLDSDFQADENNVALTKIAPIGHNTCPILAFSGFPESSGSSASFTYGLLANQGMESHSKIHPPGLVSDCFFCRLNVCVWYYLRYTPTPTPTPTPDTG